MASHAPFPNVYSMTPTSQDTHDSQVRALNARQAQLEQSIEHDRAAIGAGDGHDPSLGRELDAARSLLAQVHAELALLGDVATDSAPPTT